MCIPFALRYRPKKLIERAKRELNEMIELKKITGQVYYVSNPANMGVVKDGEKSAILIDADVFAKDPQCFKELM